MDERAQPEVLTTEGVYACIQTALAQGTPLSLVRWVDGESVIMDGDNNPELMRRHLYSHLGYVPAPNLIAVIRAGMAEAVQGCTILGCEMTKGQQTRSDRGEGYWGRTPAILDRYVPKRMPRYTCSTDAHMHLLMHGYLDKLLTGRSSLYYISGRKLDQALVRQYGIPNIRAFHIHPQCKYEVVNIGVRHFPEQYMGMRAWIQSLGDLHGQLCLVGAGYVGKVYLEWFKQQGGVAVDLGSVFDLWCGKRTRGRGKGPRATIATYKLAGLTL
jgi:hypothetical protein